MESRTKNFQKTSDEIEETDGLILGESSIPLITNLDKYPNRLKFLPKFIMLNNHQILKLKDTPCVLSPSTELDHLALRVLAEPFENEDELEDRESYPSLEVLKDRMKLVFPHSCY